MAYQEAHGSIVLGGLSRVGLSFWAAVSTVADAIAYASHVNRRLHVVERLQMKSDAELAILGIKRDDILRHVFIDQSSL